MDLKDYKSEIKRLQEEIRLADSAIARAKACLMMPSPAAAGCDLAGHTKQKQEAEAKLNSNPVKVPGRADKDSPHGLIAAAKYLEQDFIPAMKEWHADL